MGNSNPDVPSDYIHVLPEVSRPFVPRETFANQNGNTVTDNIVTEAVGDALPEVPYLQYYPAAENKQIWSNDLTNGEWSAVTMSVDQDEVGITGEPDTACTLTAAGANSLVLSSGETAASGTHSTCWFLKRKTGTGDIDITLDNAATWQTVVLTADYQKFTLDQAAVTNPVIGIRIVTSGDAVVVGNAELYLAKIIAEVRGLGPIFTTTAAVATDAVVSVHDSANSSDSDSTWYAEVTSEGAQNIIDGFLHITGTDFQLDDGTTITSRPWTVSVLNKVGIVYDTSEMALNVDGSWSADVAYDGAMLDGILDLFRATSGFAGQIREYQRFDSATLAAGKGIIDGLMAAEQTTYLQFTDGDNVQFTDGEYVEIATE
jgi:hypothetical protein